MEQKSIKRPPIVTIMGHVDHGKTTLLDYIRKSKVVEKEHGGITQHVGAYQIDDPKMTFIDTPGHAAFSDMRARGGKVADIVILVIAANDGIKPQTKECFDHIKEANVPFIVAINKIDLPEADVSKVKSELASEGYLADDQGGELVTVPISATQGTGVDQLLEMISLVADMHDISNSVDTFEGIVIESELDKNRGPIANMVVISGTIKKGDIIHAETIEGKVKALYNYLGEMINDAGPSTPVQVLGFSDVPVVGSQIHIGKASELPVIGDESTQELSKVPSDDLLPVIIKADFTGSCEAIRQSVPSGVVIIQDGVGNVTDKDILLAKTTNSIVVGFNVKVPKSVLKLAESEKIIVKRFNVIYELIDFLDDEQKKLVDPLYGIDVSGKAEVLAEFKIKKERIAGSKVIEGEITKDSNVKLLRNNELVKSVGIKSIRKGQNEVSRVKIGEEFGLVFSPYVDFKIGDTIVAYK